MLLPAVFPFLFPILQVSLALWTSWRQTLAGTSVSFHHLVLSGVVLIIPCTQPQIYYSLSSDVQPSRSTTVEVLPLFSYQSRFSTKTVGVEGYLRRQINHRVGVVQESVIRVLPLATDTRHIKAPNWCSDVDVLTDSETSRRLSGSDDDGVGILHLKFLCHLYSCTNSWSSFYET